MHFACVCDAILEAYWRIVAYSSTAYMLNI